MSTHTTENGKRNVGVDELECKSLPSVNSIKDRYYLVDSEHHQGIAIVDEDMIMYGKDDRYHLKGWRILASKKNKRFTEVYRIEDDGTESAVVIDQDVTIVLNLNDEGERWEGPVLDEMPFGWGKAF